MKIIIYHKLIANSNLTFPPDTFSVDLTIYSLYVANRPCSVAALINLSSVTIKNPVSEICQTRIRRQVNY
jgi:hypothetical protein